MSAHGVTLHATISPGERGWSVAQCLDVDVVSQVKTADEELANLQEALELYFEDEPLPVVAPVEVRVPA
jgi:predicted RNase H-like HicB family nuclease